MKRIYANVENLAKQRIINGHSYSSLGRAVNVTPNRVQQIEKYGQSVSPGLAAKICNILSVPFDEVFKIVEDTDKKGERNNAKNENAECSC